MESSKYNEPKFGDSVNELFRALDVPTNHHFSDQNIRATKYNRLESNFSRISLDFSVAHDVPFMREKTIQAIPEYPFEVTERRKKYRSL